MKVIFSKDNFHINISINIIIFKIHLLLLIDILFKNPHKYKKSLKKDNNVTPSHA